tara:strand:+ start:52 stop:1374 length:1323 start_codon:yes stop_codon:yes gene_type:complete
MFIPWLKNRKNTFTAIFVDIFILLLLYFTEKDFFYHSVEFFITILIPWILSSYIYGRYSIENAFKIQRVFYQIILRTFISLTITLIWMKLIQFFLTLFSINFYISLKDLELILKLSFLSIFFQFILFLKNNLSSKKNQNIFIIGDDIFKKIEFLPSEIRDFQKFNLLFYDENLKKESLNIQEIILTKNNLTNEEIEFCRKMSLKGIRIYNLVQWIEKSFNRTPSDLLITYDFLKSNNMPFYNLQLRLKRIGDIFVSVILLIVLLPINIILMALIKIEDGGPIFYRQTRNGFKNKTFTIWKFRSMKSDAELHGAKWAQKNDQRITKIGSFIRKMRLDETPQLINVIAGQMSLIGPRPERPEMDESLNKKINLYNFRYNIRPGLSGWAQVNFPYGASYSDSKNKLSYDLFYLQNFSFFLDLLILFKTLRLVLNLKGSKPNIL